jgi:hypothetical protein
MGSFSKANEELASIGVGSSIGHRKNTRPGMFSSESLVVKPFSIDGFTTGAIVVGKVTTLSHEARNDSVELGVFVGEFTARLASDAFFSSAEGAEVL